MEEPKSIREAIRETRGRFFSIIFLKADGSIRAMVARIGVHKGINGNGRPHPENQIILWDVQKREFRSCISERVLWMSCGHNIWDENEYSCKKRDYENWLEQVEWEEEYASTVEWARQRGMSLRHAEAWARE